MNDPDAVGEPGDRHLYAMSTPSCFLQRLWKIGVAADVAKRERKLACGQQEELRACFVWPHEAALEDYVLRQLPSPGGGGRGREWRVATEEQLHEAVRRAREEHQRLRALPPAVEPRPRKQIETLLWRIEACAYAARPPPQLRL
jgi:hypothetical protein